jgi:hypothetical protein
MSIMVVAIAGHRGTSIALVIKGAVGCCRSRPLRLCAEVPRREQGGTNYSTVESPARMGGMQTSSESDKAVMSINAA